MTRKVFISFLGANKYKPYDEVTYKIQDKVFKTRYAPEATLNLICSDFIETDKVYFFLTDDAEEYSWNNYTYNTQNGSVENIGLHNKIKENFGKLLEFPIPKIKNGKSEAEIWEIFLKIYNILNTGDEVIFDVTFGFRTSPILTMTLINYAKALKKIKIKGIYYGAYEARDGDITPIWDLISFSNLQDWASAAREFITLGKATNLSKLIDDSNPKVATQLLNLENSIATCRGYWVAKEFDSEELSKAIPAKDKVIKKQLEPLIEKIEEKILNFSNNETLKNGFAAVEWCIQHNMIQQGITFLQETLISFLIEKIIDESKINDLMYRNLSGGALNTININRNRNLTNSNKIFRESNDIEKNFFRTTYRRMYDFVNSKNPLSELYKELTGPEGFRNDINHCGFKDDYLSPKELKKKLKNLFRKIKNLNLA